MYKIGEFSKITNLTIKALRYYDEEGILIPSSYSDSGYRLYNQENFDQAKKIVLLKELDFSIKEIKDVLANLYTNEDLHFYLKEKQLKIKASIKKQKEVIRKIDTYLLPTTNLGGNYMSYTIQTKEILEVTVAAIRFIGEYQTMGNPMAKLYKYLKSNVAGAPFACYFDGEFKEQADIELCVPIKEHIEGNAEITIKTLPKINVLATTHIGRYEDLGNAYKAVMDYAKAHQIELITPTREVYQKGPSMMFKGNPDKYVTEIYIPIK